MSGPDPFADVPPGPSRLRWRLGVLDHDLANGDLQAPAEQMAGWYVEDVAHLLDLLGRLEWARTGFCPTCSAARGSPHDPGCELADVLHPRTQNDPPAVVG